MNEKKLSTIFSKNLIRLLNKQNKNQYELADYIGVSSQTITNYVKGYNFTMALIVVANTVFSILYQSIILCNFYRFLSVGIILASQI